MNHFSFQYPWAFGVVAIFAVCAFFCKVKRRSIYFPHLKTFMLGSPKISYLPLVLKWVGVVLGVVALASPIMTKSYENSSKNGRDIVLILDTSSSMIQGEFDETNLSKSRFMVVKELASRFVDGRKSDRVGLVTFADVAFVSAPLTFEKEFLSTIIKLQKLGVAGQKTAINDALVQAYSMLERSGVKSKIAILLTDGVDNMSQVSASDIKAIISKRDVKLYTIGIGSGDDYNAEALKSLAKAGEGEYFEAKDSKALQKIYNKIDKMERTKIEIKKLIEKKYLFVYPLLFSILFLLFFVYYQTIHSSGGRS